MRVAVGGFMHETNSFSPVPTRYEDFAHAGDREPLVRGAAMLETFSSSNVGVGGALDVLRGAGLTPVPLLWASAAPAGHVTRDAYERIVAMLLDDLRAALPVDGIYLCLHGAMVVEHVEDGEGELLGRVRALVGDSVPIVASLDFHSNTTPQMFRLADALVSYRTYPHVDMRDTGRRSAELLVEVLKGRVLHRAFRQLDFLIPLTWQGTTSAPCKALIAELVERETGPVASLSFTPGFPAADIHDCGPTVFGYGWDANATAHAVEALAQAVRDAERDFGGRLYSADDAAVEAKRLCVGSSRPIVLADTQDNPGAGGTGDTVWLLDALVRHAVDGAVVASIADAASAKAAHAAGLGATIDVEIGAKSGLPSHTPLRVRARVERLTDGSFTGTGPMAYGRPQRLGPTALLAIGGVRVIVASRKTQALDQSLLRHVGIEPAQARVIALKSSVHFRADFEPIAERVLVVAAPGLMLVDPAALPFRRLRRGVRLRPGDLGSAF
ncbi:MAG: M81 family metallopeptidase [Lautropia sp.]